MTEAASKEGHRRAPASASEPAFAPARCCPIQGHPEQNRQRKAPRSARDV